MILRKLYPLLIFILIASPNTFFAHEKNAKKMITIGVVQSFSHPDIEADIKGFEKALTEAGFKEGVHLTYLRRNANGNRTDAEKIAQKLLEDKVDLIHSIGSIASRAAVKNTRRLPIVFSSVTNPVDEGLVPKSSPPGTTSGTNVTGVTDRWPVPLQLEMYTQFFLKAKKWGTLYNRRDPVSLLHIREMRETAKRLGLELIETMISDKADTMEAAQALSGNIQALNITFDFTALSAFDGIVKVCSEKKIPLFVGDVDKVTAGAMAAYGFNHDEVGYLAGKKAVRILQGEKPGNLPWEPVEKLSLVINEKAAKAQGVVIPPEFLRKADRVIEE
jgi:putative tryptophan/tyrosine transport system substrate-binding protein